MPSGDLGEIALESPEATLALGRWLGRHLAPGDFVGLTGELGAGKTVLARGIAQGLAVDDPDAVCSPTYLLVVEHPGPVPLLHADAYLPAKLEGFLQDGGLDYLTERGAAVVVEWADRIAAQMPPDAIWIALEPLGPTARTARLRASSPDRFPWLAVLPTIGS